MNEDSEHSSKLEQAITLLASIQKPRSVEPGCSSSRYPVEGNYLGNKLEYKYE